MALPRDRQLKQKLSERLIYHSLLRMLILDRTFRIGFFAVVGTILFLAIYLPKIWRTTPKNFNPQVKISLLDKTQNWSLKRTARKAQAHGDHQQAYYSWQAAVAQDPGDKAALRGFLNNFLALQSPTKEQIQAGLGQSFWLLRLGQTNDFDVDLISTFFEKIRRSDLLAQVFGEFPDKLPAKAKERYLEALFLQGRIEEFAGQLAKYPIALPDSALGLYRLAYKAGWEKGPGTAEALEQLYRRAQSGNIDSTRLYMMVCAQRDDLAGYAECLKTLSRVNEATTPDYVVYWERLASAGRKTEAAQFARDFSGAPRSMHEMLKLAEAYYHLGLADQAGETLKRFASQFGYSPEVWISYGSLLEELRKWDELRGLALQIRQERNYRDTLGGLSHFLEGRADLGAGRTATAGIAFRKAGESTFESAAVGLFVAKRLMAIAYYREAKAILQRLDRSMLSEDAFLETAFDCALQLKEGEWVLEIALQAYKNNPGDPQKANRYAAALIANRVRPEEAVKITIQLLNDYPDSPAAIVNHALALLLNRRNIEAKATLERILPHQLSASEISPYYLAMFEAHLLGKEYSRAWEDSDKINRLTLFPAQEKWLRERVKELPPRVTGVY